MLSGIGKNDDVKSSVERWVGDYQLHEELGRGGMGVVYRAVRPSDGALAAIKILPLALAQDDARLRRFEREGRLAQQVRHPNLIAVEACGRLDDGTLYLRMELLQGLTLRAALDESRGRLGPQAALTVCAQVAEGLAAMHQNGIVHRDVKPSNVMWTDEQRTVAKLLDFGIARAVTEQDDLTSDRVAVGTARYMSPEQCIGTSQLTHATDLYSLGVVLFESLLGVHPLMQGAERREDLLQMHRLGGHRRMEQLWPAAPAALVQLVDSLLSRDPAQRPDAEQTAKRLAALIPFVPAEPLSVEEGDAPAGVDATEDPQAPDLSDYLASPQAIEKQQDVLSKPSVRAASLLLGSVGAMTLLLGVTEVALRMSTGTGTSSFVDWLLHGKRDNRSNRTALLPKSPPPLGMVEIEGGRYLQGSTQDRIETERRACLAEERESACTVAMFDREFGPREVQLSPFFLDRTEVTNAAFVEWLNSGRRAIAFEEDHILRIQGKQIASTHGQQTGIAKDGERYVVKPGMGQLPVVNVSWIGAMNYCTDQGKSLPTEAEFEYVASRHGKARYPWGDRDPSCNDAVSIGHDPFMRCEGSKQPNVGTMSQDVTPEGVHDLGGSVKEWLMDRFVQRYRPCSPCVNPVAPEGPTDAKPAGTRAVRGSAFLESKVPARAAFRSRANEDNVYETIGFRCALRLHSLQSD